MVPLERWDVDGFAALSSNALEARFGSFIPGAALLDAAAFGISRPEASEWALGWCGQSLQASFAW